MSHLLPLLPDGNSILALGWEQGRLGRLQKCPVTCPVVSLQCQPHVNPLLLSVAGCATPFPCSNVENKHPAGNHWGSNHCIPSKAPGTLCQLLSLDRGKVDPVLVARREPEGISSPSSLCERSAVSFIKFVFLISAAPLCQHQAVLGSVFLCRVTRTPQSCPKNVAEPRGRAWVPEVAVAAGCCGFSSCSHRQREPLCCRLGRKLPRCFCSAAAPGPRRADLRAAGCWGHGQGAVTALVTVSPGRNSPAAPQ